MSNSEPLEKFEQEFLERMRQMSKQRIGIQDEEGLEPLVDTEDISFDIEDNTEDQGTIYLIPGMIDNYARTQRNAERLNKAAGFNCLVGCTCGHLHQKDSLTGHVDTGWY